MLSHSVNLYKNLQKRYSRRINLDLERIQKVLAALSFPQLELKNPINIVGRDGKMSTLTSLKYFLTAHKKFWLIPIMIILLIFSVLIILSQGSAVAPFIYTIF